MRAANLSFDCRKRLMPVSGYPHIRALIPLPCPRVLDTTPILAALIAADKAIAKTYAMARRLSQPDLITRSLQRREAVLSSQIEGTDTNLTQLFEYEATGSDKGLSKDAMLTMGYVRAWDYGLRAVRCQGSPHHLTLDLIRQLHSVLMAGSDYHHSEGAGAWRQVQNWIGAWRIKDAMLIPPPVEAMGTCLLDLESFLRGSPNSLASMALPLRMAVAYVQFHSIQPFSDGNSRVGRLLPSLMMSAEGLPPLYLAGYLKMHQREYYDGLAGAQLQGRWTGWLRFFLAGIVEAATTEQVTVRALLDVRERWRLKTVHLRADAAAQRLLDVLLGAPVQTAATVRDALGVSEQAASKGIAALYQLDILHEVTGGLWKRRFHAHEVLTVLEREELCYPSF